MKLCKDCKHIELGVFSRCYHPNNIKKTVDPVNGTTKLNYKSFMYCDAHRNCGFFTSRIFNSCGKSGRWFEEK